jgi:tetratricopeptide (TPR) repeat protein
MRLFRLKQRKPSLLTLGDRARDARQWELASRFYRKALNQNPHNSPIWVQYGHALKESGELRDPDKLAQAEIAYRRSLSLDPRVADSYLQLGHVLKIQGKKEEASAAYLQAIALGSSWDGATMELANLGWSEAHFSELGSMLNTDVVPDWPASDPETVKGNEAISRSDIADLRGHDLSLSEPDHELAPQPHDSELNDSEIISREFDREYYLGAYPDINPPLLIPLNTSAIRAGERAAIPAIGFLPDIILIRTGMLLTRESILLRTI